MIDSTIHTTQTDQNVIQMPNLESFKVCGPGWGGELTTHHPSQHFLYTSCGVELQGEDELQEKHDNLQSWIHSTMKAFVLLVIISY